MSKCAHHLTQNMPLLPNGNSLDKESPSIAKDLRSCLFPVQIQFQNFKEDFTGKILEIKHNLSSLRQSVVYKSEEIENKGFVDYIFQDLLQKIDKLNQRKCSSLGQGLLIFFQEIIQIKEKVSSMKVFSFLAVFLNSCFQTVSQLLKIWLLHQEYKRKIKHIKDIEFSSSYQLSSSFSQSQKSTDQSQIFYRLKQEIDQQPIHQLINNYLKNEVEALKQKEETCSICSHKIKLQNVQRHVKLCRKISDQKQRINEIIFEEEELIREVKKFYEDEWQIEEEQKENIKRIVTSLLTERIKKQKTLRRRSQNSLQSRSQKHLIPRWEILYYEHEDSYGEVPLLSKILQIQKDKIRMERNICALENIIMSEHLKLKQNQDKMITSTHNLMISKVRDRKTSGDTTISFPSKKTTLNDTDKVLSESEECSSEENNFNFASKESLNDFDQKLKKMRSRRLLNNSCYEFQEDEEKKYCSMQQLPMQQEDHHMSLEDFQILKVLGQGTFGKVYMVRRKGTQSIYALKIIHLPDETTEKDIQNIKTEHDIFRKIAGEHLVNAPFSFSEKDSHIFVMELMPGGNLRTLLNKQIYLEEDAARMYLAEVVLAIEYLHNHDIIHRDLKPENLVLDAEGHLKLTDFGLSAITMEQRLKNSIQLNREAKDIKRRKKRRVAVKFQDVPKTTLIGTPDYIAPEIVNNVSISNKSIDWWSLGVMAYELVIGTRPFCGDTIEQVVENIREFKIQWPEIGTEDGISFEVKDLIQKLLNRDFTERLGAEGAKEVKSHPFFQGIDWAKIKKEKAFFKPDLAYIQESVRAPEDIQLRQELLNVLRRKQKIRNRFRLQSFVRYDILGSETMQKAQRILNEETDRLIKLNTCRGLKMEGQQINGDSVTYFV